MSTKFDPTRYKNKKTVYIPIPNYQGIYAIWDWAKTKQRYVKRTIGNKFYSVKRVNCHQVTKCFVHLHQAMEWRSETDGYLWDQDVDITFDDLKNKFFAKKASELRISSLETYHAKAKHLDYFKGLIVKEINPKTIDAWLEHLKSKKYLDLQHDSRLSFAKELSLLRQILLHYGEYICEDNSYSLPIKKRHRSDCIISKVKMDLIKAKSKQKFLPNRVIQSFLGELEKRSEIKSQYEVYYLLALFQYSTGVRIGEAAALSWKALDFKDCKAFIYKNVCWSRKKGRKTFVSDLTKTGESRWIYLTPQLILKLKQWSLKSGRSCGLIFSHDGISPIAYRKIQYNYDKALKAIGAEWTGTHILRHSFATDFLEKTGEQKALQAQLGHQTAEQTNHYAKITESYQKSAMEKYSRSLDEQNELLESC